MNVSNMMLAHNFCVFEPEISLIYLEKSQKTKANSTIDENSLFCSFFCFLYHFFLIPSLIWFSVIRQITDFQICLVRFDQWCSPRENINPSNNHFMVGFSWVFFFFINFFLYFLTSVLPFFARFAIPKWLIIFHKTK